MNKALLIIVQEYIISDFSSFCNAPLKTYALPHRFLRVLPRLQSIFSPVWAQPDTTKTYKEGYFVSLGMILLVVLALLILFGVLQRVLDRMALTDRQALFLVALIFAGGWLPDLRLGMVSVNIGGALVPFGVCVYLFFHAGTGKERIRCLIASVLTAAVIYVISLFFPADPVAMPFDPMVLYGLCGGIIAWLMGRSRRSAFIAGVLGVILADAATGVVNWSRGINQVLYLGGAGALDAIVLSSITAVMLCELVGEIAERIARGKANGSTLRGGQHA